MTSKSSSLKKRLFLSFIVSLLAVQLFLPAFSTNVNAITSYSSADRDQKLYLYNYANIMSYCYSITGVHSGGDMIAGGNIFNDASNRNVINYIPSIVSDFPTLADSNHDLGCEEGSNEFSKKFFTVFDIDPIEFVCGVGYTRKNTSPCIIGSGDFNTSKSGVDNYIKNTLGIDLSNPDADITYLQRFYTVVNACTTGENNPTMSLLQYNSTPENIRYSLSSFNNGSPTTKYYVGQEERSAYIWVQGNGYPDNQQKCDRLETASNDAFKAYSDTLIEEVNTKCSELGYRTAYEKAACSAGAFSGDPTVCATNYSRYAGYDDGTSEARILACESGANGIVVKSGLDELDNINNPKDENVSSCQIDGIGWIVCAVMNAVAGANDWMYSQIQDTLQINPLSTSGPNDQAYKVWIPIRDIANVLLVIAFLIIIFSQVSNIGVTNYGIKKMLPRIILVAIAINLSFVVMQLSVDLVNIIGRGLYDLITGISGSSASMATIDASWTNLVATILAGGTGTVVGVTIAATASWSAVGMMALPFVLGALLAIFAAFITLAVRNALIIILAIASPLAFAAFLLPNTKNLFDKWRKLFMGMLFLYPTASLLFGGAQLAGWITFSQEGAVNKIMGMFIMAAPLFMLPWLAKSSGGILAKVGDGIGKVGKNIQNRTQKALDPGIQARKAERRAELEAGERGSFGNRRDPNKTRDTLAMRRLKNEEKRMTRKPGESDNDWKERKADIQHRQANLMNAGKDKRTPQTLAQSLAMGRVSRELNTERAKKLPGEQLKAMANKSNKIDPVTGKSALESAGYSGRASKIANRTAGVIAQGKSSDIKAKIVESESGARFDRANEGAILNLRGAEGQGEEVKSQIDTAAKELSTNDGLEQRIKEVQESGLTPEQKSAQIQQLSQSAQVLKSSSQGKWAADTAGTIAQNKISEETAKEALENLDFQAAAAGRAGGDAGVQKVKSRAEAIVDKAEEDEVADASISISTLSGKQNEMLALNGKVTYTDSLEKEREFSGDAAQKAAIDTIFKVGSYDQQKKVVLASGTGKGLNKYVTRIKNKAAQSSLVGRNPAYSGITIDDIGKGLVSNETLQGITVRAIADDKFSAEAVADMHPEGLKDLYDTLSIRSEKPEIQKKIDDTKDALKLTLQSLKGSDLYGDKVAGKPGATAAIEKLLDME